MIIPRYSKPRPHTYRGRHEVCPLRTRNHLFLVYTVQAPRRRRNKSNKQTKTIQVISDLAMSPSWSDPSRWPNSWASRRGITMSMEPGGWSLQVQSCLMCGTNSGKAAGVVWKFFPKGGLEGRMVITFCRLSNYSSEVWIYTLQTSLKVHRNMLDINLGQLWASYSSLF